MCVHYYSPPSLPPSLPFSLPPSLTHLLTTPQTYTNYLLASPYNITGHLPRVHGGGVLQVSLKYGSHPDFISPGFVQAPVGVEGQGLELGEEEGRVTEDALDGVMFVLSLPPVAPAYGATNLATLQVTYTVSEGTTQTETDTLRGEAVTFVQCVDIGVVGEEGDDLEDVPELIGPKGHGPESDG